MLVLRRRRGEKIIIGCGEDAVTITVCKASRGVVRLGIEAPIRVLILRHELLVPPAAPCERYDLGGEAGVGS